MQNPEPFKMKKSLEILPVTERSQRRRGDSNPHYYQHFKTSANIDVLLIWVHIFHFVDTFYGYKIDGIQREGV